LCQNSNAEVGAVVGRDDEAAVHVGVPARLVAEQSADGVDLGASCANVRRSRTVAPGISGAPR
jgi:hypothetical protein